MNEKAEAIATILHRIAQMEEIRATLDEIEGSLRAAIEIVNPPPSAPMDRLPAWLVYCRHPTRAGMVHIRKAKGDPPLCGRIRKSVTVKRPEGQVCRVCLHRMAEAARDPLECLL